MSARSAPLDPPPGTADGGGTKAPGPPGSSPFPPPFLRLLKLRFLSWQPGPSGLPLPEVLDLELLKAGHLRGVYRTRVAGRPAILKLSFHPLGRLKLWRERRRLGALARRGLPAPQVLGSGRPVKGRWALVSEELSGGTAFDSAFQEAVDRTARRGLLAALSASLKALHSRGIEHRDPHPRNLLVGPGGAAWIDATGFRILRSRRPLSARRARRNLAAVHAAFAATIEATPSEWLRALRLYLGPRAGRKERRRWARAVLRLSRNARRRSLRRRATRCLRSNRDFLAARQGGRQAFLRREALGPSWERFFENPDSLFEEGSILKDGRSTRAARILWNGRPAFLKRYHRPGLLHHLKYLFRRSRAVRSWKLGYALELRSIPVPRALAVLTIRRSGWLVSSYLVTEWAEGSASDRILAEAPETGRALVRGLAATLARAHALGVWHRDLKPQNVFFDAARRRVSLVDLDGVRIRRRLKARQRTRDLARWLRDIPPGDGVRAALLTFYRERFAKASCLPERFP